MRRGRIFLYLALILLLGLVAVAVVWYRTLQPGAATPVAEATPTPVVELAYVIVSTQRIPRGGLLDETVLGTIPIQRDLLIQGYQTDLEQVIGRRARVDLEANMLLTDSMIVDGAEQLSATGSIAALSIPPGMVAVSIPIGHLSSVSYAPQAGDHVNVIATLLMVNLDTEFQSILPNNTSAVLGAGPGVVIGSGTGEDGTTEVNAELLKITAQNATGGYASVVGRTEIDPLLQQTFYTVPSERQRPRLVSQTLLQDAVVLGLGYFPLTDETEQAATAQEEPQVPAEGVEEAAVAPAEEQTEPAPEPEPEYPKVITLIVTPQDAVTLNYMVFAGAQLTLALRPTGDDTRVETEAATLDFLLKTYNIPVPLSLPYGMEPRVDELDLPEIPSVIEPTPVP